mmetsp:Transcript_7908/g.15110  ORF Transcript_7908/g.15110 Transcript_7908/m.15110 type:complete len:192 (-) Transcript_7908:265-840(-)
MFDSHAIFRWIVSHEATTKPQSTASQLCCEPGIYYRAIFYLYHLFIFIYSFIYSFVYSFVHLFIYLCIIGFIYLSSVVAAAAVVVAQVVALLPLLAAADALSEEAFAREIWCIEKALCAAPSTTHLDTIKMWSWRDLISLSLMLACWGMSCWLLPLFGTCGNILHLPRLEHRALSKRLDQQLANRSKVKFV